MKRLNQLGILALCILGLSACSSSSIDITGTQVKPDLSHETWISEINLDTNQWTRDADAWFFSGKASPTEKANNNASYSAAITTAAVRVPDVTQLKIDGHQHVQLVGRQDHNSAYIYGPNEAIRQTVVEVRNNTIYIHDAKGSLPRDLEKVVVRIGLRNITQLNVSGNITLEGKEITSDSLSIKSSNSGRILLAGNINLNNISNSGTGSITVLGTDTPVLNISTSNGAVRVSGRVGIHWLVSSNKATIDILGADSDNLSIKATDSSKQTIAGYANLKKLIAAGRSRVNLYWVNAQGGYVSGYDEARIGLAGAARNMNIDISGSSRFEGQYLRAENLYVRTRGRSHANVNSSKKLFAAALDNSSIYFFGSPNIVNRYTSYNGVIIPVWNDAGSLPSTSLPPPVPMPATEPASSAVSYKNERALK